MPQSLDEPKPSWQDIAKHSGFSIGLPMRDDARRQRFLQWFAGKPCYRDRAKLMQLTGLTKGRVSQLFDDKQPFGERAAAGLAERLGLPSDVFEPIHYSAAASSALEAREPPPPPPGFADRHEVSDSDWATLEAVKLLMTDQEIASLRRRASAVQQKALEQLLELQRAAEDRAKKPT